MKPQRFIAPLTALLLVAGGGTALSKAPQKAPTQSPQKSAACPALLNHTLKTLANHQPENLCNYQGKVLLIVNTASFCGYTPQYSGLQSLYDKYKDQGLVVMGFPSGNFKNQEHNSDQEIAQFCKEKYQVSFPMYSKSDVSGKNANEIFKELTARTGQAPLWNFHKYLIDRQGNKVLSFGSNVKPEDPKLQQELEKFLKG